MGEIKNQVLQWKISFFVYQNGEELMLPLFFSYGKENRVLTRKNVFFFTEKDEGQCYLYSFLMGRRSEI